MTFWAVIILLVYCAMTFGTIPFIKDPLAYMSAHFISDVCSFLLLRVTFFPVMYNFFFFHMFIGGDI